MKGSARVIENLIRKKKKESLQINETKIEEIVINSTRRIYIEHRF